MGGRGYTMARTGVKMVDATIRPNLRLFGAKMEYRLHVVKRMGL